MIVRPVSLFMLFSLSGSDRSLTCDRLHSVPLPSATSGRDRDQPSARTEHLPDVEDGREVLQLEMLELVGTGREEVRKT